MKNSNIPTEALLDWLRINFPTRDSLEPIKRMIVRFMMVRHYPKLRFDDIEYRFEADEYWFLFKWMDHSELVEWCDESGDSMDGYVDLYSVAVCVQKQNKNLQEWNEMSEIEKQKSEIDSIIAKG